MSCHLLAFVIDTVSERIGCGFIPTSCCSRRRKIQQMRRRHTLVKLRENVRCGVHVVQECCSSRHSPLEIACSRDTCVALRAYALAAAPASSCSSLRPSIVTDPQIAPHSAENQVNASQSPSRNFLVFSLASSRPDIHLATPVQVRQRSRAARQNRW